MPDNAAQRPLIWANLVHLSHNMWCDHENPEVEGYNPYKPYLRFDEGLWNDLVRRMAEAGLNMVVLDLGDGVAYGSHPEIAVQGAWSPGKLRQELANLRAVGLEPIPKLNFSTAHDAWLAQYSRMVSSERYYDVCRDLIGEVLDLFDGPRFFHLGMDEETWEHQRTYEYAQVRQHGLWWRDLHFLVDQVERGGSRAWVWSDHVWHNPKAFYANMPTSVVQSNWYYEPGFDAVWDEEQWKREGAQPRDYSEAYLASIDMDWWGFDQIPAGSNWSSPSNFGGLTDYCLRSVSRERLLGFLQTVWRPTLPECREKHLAAIEQVAQARLTSR